MAAGKNTILKDIEELVQKSAEANKLFITEGSKFIQQLGSKKSGENIKTFQPDAIANVVTAYMQLNIQHLKNMVDLGVSLTKEMMGQKNEDNETVSKENKPAFNLKGNGRPGSTINVHFLIDNVKTEAAVCTMINTAYTLEAVNTKQQNFITVFSPQAFTIEPGASQAVGISIKIPKKTTLGIYTSVAQVQGFEPAFFSISLTITEP
jgi:hypothetical protein